MAFIDPRQVNLVPNTDLFTRVLTSLAGNKMQEDRQNQYQEQQTQQAKGNKSAALFAMRLAGLPMADKKGPLQEMARQMAKSGRDTSDIMSLINMQDEDELNLALERLAMDSDPDTYASMTKKQPEGLASAKTEILEDGSVIQAMPDGSTKVRNAQGTEVFGQERINIIRAAREAQNKKLQDQSDIQVNTARRSERAKLSEQRFSEMSKTFSERNQNAARALPRLEQTLKLIEQAEQGWTGKLKLQASRFYPEIDVSNEGALSSSLLSLAMDELQAFKGPTTDFEFGKAQDIAGQLGDAKTANRARVKAIKRANWFNRREYEQFKKWRDAGKNADDFNFNFNEMVDTKKGAFTLRQIQDTAVANHLTIEETLSRLNK